MTPKPNIVEKSREKYLEAEQRHRRIVEEAIRIFNDYGYPGTTTQRIAQAAGITERTLYRHFAGKQELFHECTTTVVRELRALWRGEGGNDNPLDYLNAVIRTYVRFVRTKPDSSKFLVQLYSYRMLPEVDAGFRRMVQAFIDEAEQVIAKLQEQNRIASELPARTLGGIFISQYFTLVFLADFLPADELTEEHALRFVHDAIKLK